MCREQTPEMRVWPGVNRTKDGPRYQVKLQVVLNLFRRKLDRKLFELRLVALVKQRTAWVDYQVWQPDTWGGVDHATVLDIATTYQRPRTVTLPNGQLRAVPTPPQAWATQYGMGVENLRAMYQQQVAMRNLRITLA